MGTVLTEEELAARGADGRRLLEALDAQRPAAEIEPVDAVVAEVAAAIQRGLKKTFSRWPVAGKVGVLW